MTVLTGPQTTFVLKQMAVGPMQNFCYIIGDRSSRQAFVVDPCWEAEKILKEIESEDLKLAGIIATHSHYDHVNIVDAFLKEKDLPVYVNKDELVVKQYGLDIFVDLSKNAKVVGDNDEIKLGHTGITCLHTPGHTPGGQCVQVGDYLLTGDTLFIGGCGRYDLPGGSPEALEASLKRISKLAGSLIICPGHDYGDVPQKKLEMEKKDNKFLKK